jgi:hypothetical protein
MKRQREYHGMWGTGIYKAWSEMKRRCTNPADHTYPRYGGRGISYDPRWETFSAFHADMGERPSGF